MNCEVYLWYKYLNKKAKKLKEITFTLNFFMFKVVKPVLEAIFLLTASARCSVGKKCIKSAEYFVCFWGWGGVGYEEPTVDLKQEHNKLKDIRITAV